MGRLNSRRRQLRRVKQLKVEALKRYHSEKRNSAVQNEPFQDTVEDFTLDEDSEEEDSLLADNECELDYDVDKRIGFLSSFDGDSTDDEVETTILLDGIPIRRLQQSPSDLENMVLTKQELRSLKGPHRTTLYRQKRKRITGEVERHKYIDYFAKRMFTKVTVRQREELLPFDRKRGRQPLLTKEQLLDAKIHLKKVTDPTTAEERRIADRLTNATKHVYQSLVAYVNNLLSSDGKITRVNASKAAVTAIYGVTLPHWTKGQNG